MFNLPWYVLEALRRRQQALTSVSRPPLKIGGAEPAPGREAISHGPRPPSTPFTPRTLPAAGLGAPRVVEPMGPRVPERPRVPTAAAVPRVTGYAGPTGPAAATARIGNLPQLSIRAAWEAAPPSGIAATPVPERFLTARSPARAIREERAQEQLQSILGPITRFFSGEPNAPHPGQFPGQPGFQQPQVAIGSTRQWHGQTYQVVNVKSGNPIYRRIGDPTPGERLTGAEQARVAGGLGPSGGSLLRYLDSLAQSTGSLPGFGGVERANEVAEFLASLPSSQQVMIDDTGTPRQTQVMFQTSVWFSEQAYRSWEQAGFPVDAHGRPYSITPISTEAVWDVIAARNNWGISGADFLRSQGYTPRGGGIWEWIPEPRISGYGGGTFSSGAGAGGGGFGFPVSGDRNFAFGLVNWRI